MGGVLFMSKIADDDFSFAVHYNIREIKDVSNLNVGVRKRKGGNMAEQFLQLFSSALLSTPLNIVSLVTSLTRTFPVLHENNISGALKVTNLISLPKRVHSHWLNTVDSFLFLLLTFVARESASVSATRNDGLFKIKRSNGKLFFPSSFALACKSPRRILFSFQKISRTMEPENGKGTFGPKISLPKSFPRISAHYVCTRTNRPSTLDDGGVISSYEIIREYLPRVHIIHGMNSLWEYMFTVFTQRRSFFIPK